MSRKPLHYTSEFPYHITARSNNKEPFAVPLCTCWEVFIECLKHCRKKFDFQVHAFVLMNNHYHLIASCSEEYPLYEIMAWLQRNVNLKIHKKCSRINHLFGGRYKGCLIKDEIYYYNAIKYVYRNPIDAGLVKLVQDYQYSSLLEANSNMVFAPKNGIDSLIPSTRKAQINLVNEPFHQEAFFEVRKNLRKTEMKWKKNMDPIVRKNLFSIR